MLKQGPRRASVLAVLVLALFGAACGGGGDDDAAPTGDPTRFTIWAPQPFQRPVDGLVQQFQQEPANADTEIEVIYGDALELNDRLLLGERPDLYLASGNDLQKLIDDGTMPNELVALGEDLMQLIVAPGNPKGIVDASVFGVDPTTTSGLCEQDLDCGRAARALLANAGVIPEPDVNAPNAKYLLSKVADGSIDATLVWRGQSFKARQEGLVEYVALPSTQRVAVPVQFAVVKHGEAVDAFIEFVQTSNRTQRVLALVGLAPLEGDPQ